jgi:hypothetical protein
MQWVDMAILVSFLRKSWPYGAVAPARPTCLHPYVVALSKMISNNKASTLV